MPPSPRLSARITTPRYLTEITSTRAQKTSDSTPSTSPGVGRTLCTPVKHSLMAYRGLVPISPYTTPSAVRESVNR